MRYSLAQRPAKPTIRVLMQRDAVGAPDGITRTEYKAGQEYDLPEDLAGCFFSTGEADPAEAHAQHAGGPAEPAEPPAGVPSTPPEKRRRRPIQPSREG